MTSRLGLVKAAASLAAAAALALAAPWAAAGNDFAPLDRPGPELKVAKEELRQNLTCHGGLRRSPEPTILFVAGTTLEPRTNFGWNWLRALDDEGRPHCEIEVPANSQGDIQVAAEYIVYAIRKVSRRSGRDIDIVGHSQGGMSPRWSLRFWPGLRDKVDDLVGLAASNHGTITSKPFCVDACPPSFRQQNFDSAFIEALNSRAEVFDGIDYTAVYTHNDAVVVPNLNDSGSTSLQGGGANVANLAVQDLCPANTADHLAMGSYDPVAYAIARDALDHAGTADLDRVDPAVCGEPFMPGVRPETFATDYAALVGVLATTIATSEQTRSEPPLRCYVFKRCPRR